MENETPDFFEERDLLGLVKPKIPVTGNENPDEQPYFEEDEFKNGYRDAPKSARFFNYLVDSVGGFAFAFLIVILLNIFGIKHLVDEEDNKVILIFLGIIYYLLWESISGRTLGKLVTGTKVVTDEGEDIGFPEALGRTLCRFIPFEIFSFLFAKKGWHDSITKTRVVLINKETQL